MKVYIAARSSEIDRAARMIQRVHDHPGLELTHDWVEDMRKEARPDESIPPVDARKYAQADLDGVLSADVLWLLDGAPGGAGRWFEFGAAVAAGKRIVISGSPTSSIFCALADHHFGEDNDAWWFLVGYSEEP